MTKAETRHFLFLQGPHGPFFDELGRALSASGHSVLRVGFNRGDERFWRDRETYLPFTGQPANWPDAAADLLSRHAITDIVLYGDTRPIHAAAIAAARSVGARIHVFEEGYLRPYWVTYERGGSNGHSALMKMAIADMAAALRPETVPARPAPGHWGDMREHMFYGALYHFHVMARNARYRDFQPHRGISVAREFRLHLRRLMLMPLHRLERAVASLRIRFGGFACHLVLLQLEHDASFRDHSDLGSMADFVALCLKGFAEGAPSDQHLVFKAHPLEDGRIPLRATIRNQARALGLAGRVHFVRGGKLAALLDRALSAVTVNSTAAQQALWRGLPVRAFGRAVYAKPGLVSPQELADFFAAPLPPDAEAYAAFRRYLLATSQVPGGFYSARGRRLLMLRLPALILAGDDPYQTLAAAAATSLQQSAAPV